MKVTFIKHSGFLIEWESCVWLIDYYHGKIPVIDQAKKLLVFCSHKHSDHFNSKIFKKFRDFQAVEYILSSDIKPAVESLPLKEDQMKQITYIQPLETKTVSDGGQGEILIQTLNSTDCGVAFVMKYNHQTIYHAGDLNCWVWKGEPEEENRRMTDAYITELKRLKELAGSVDAAFVPLDPRQEEWYAKGLLYYAREVGAKNIFPMHFWGKHEVIRQLLSSSEAGEYGEHIVPIEHSGESWDL